MFGETPTRRPVSIYGQTVYRFADDRIAEDREAFDEADLLRQVVTATPG